MMFDSKTRLVLYPISVPLSMDRESLFSSRRETTAFGNQARYPSESARRQSSAAFLRRRSTTVGPYGAMKTDLQSVRGGDVVRSSCAKLEAFLRKLPLKEALSPKAFVSPTSRDFAIIWESLLAAFDSRYI